MRKKVVALGAILLLIGAAMVAYGIMNAGNVVEEEKTYNLSDPEEFYEWIHAAGEEDPAPSSIDPVIILGGTIVAASGVVFLIKSKDEDFLPGI
ncbi:MAG TPA: hypothetical protein PL092_02265 [Candidatus Pacearchaeota archaeon]|jgi:hypothetical protein|nr:hypothetical protein [Candidatus Pacearchaeota archaeon]